MSYLSLESINITIAVDDGLVCRVVDLRPRGRGFEACHNLRVGLASVHK